MRVPVGSPDEVEIKLYPEAVIAGTVSAPDGDPLSQIHIQALRRYDDDAGSRWQVAAQTNTNSDGQFRLPLPGGDYIVETQYSPERPGIHDAVLPMMSPSAGSASGSTIHVVSGSEEHLDLRPSVRAGHSVHIKIDGDDGMPQLQAHLSNGLTFGLSSRPPEGGSSDEVVANLPSGTYTLSARTNSGPSASYGETRVTVTDHDVTGIVLHMTRTPQLSFEVALDPAVTSDNVPTAQQLGLSFYRTDSPPGFANQTTYVNQRRGESPSVTLFPGSYRLRAPPSNQWFIESASLGGADLLSDDFVVDPASSGASVRLIVSNQTATLKGTVKLGERPAACWVYMIATTPSASPVINMMSAEDGTLTRSYLPPGNYRVLASESRLYANLMDPAVQTRFDSHMQTVSIAPGETGTVELTAVPASEVKP